MQPCEQVDCGVKNKRQQQHSSDVNHNDSVHEEHDRFCFLLLTCSDDSMGYQYPFTLRVVGKDGNSCAWCPWYR